YQETTSKTSMRLSSLPTLALCPKLPSLESSGVLVRGEVYTMLIISTRIAKQRSPSWPPNSVFRLKSIVWLHFDGFSIKASTVVKWEPLRRARISKMSG
ncbi:hypothetical protein FOZ62_007910, partial [Perkinsus olseni]